MLSRYHLEVKSENPDVESHDATAKRLVDSVHEQIEATGGKVGISRGFGLAPAIIVLELPNEDIKPETFFPKLAAQQVEGTATSEPSAS